MKPAFFALATSFCALAYQQLVVYSLTEASTNFVLCQAVTLGVFLLGMGIGSWRAENMSGLGWTRLMRIEIAVGVLGLFAIAYINLSEILMTYFVGHAREWLLLVAAPYLLLLGYFTGLEIPCLLKIEGDVNRILGYNYVGAFLAAIGVPLIFLPTFDVHGSVTLLSLVNFSMAASLADMEKWKNRIATAGLALLVMGWVLYEPKLRDLHLRFIYFPPQFTSWSNVGNDFQVLEHLDSPLRMRSRYQWIDILLPEFSQEVQIRNPMVLFLDRQLQFSSLTSSRYHESMVHAGIQLLGREPERVLILGGGDGLLIKELKRHRPEVTEVELVELDPKMIELAREFPSLRSLNENAFDEPWVQVHVGDAFRFIRQSEKKYDLILVDLPFPLNYDLNMLYSREFYAFVRKRLNDTGLMILDFPAPEKALTREMSVLLQTLKSAGFQSPLAFGPDELFVAASRDNRALRLEKDEIKLPLSEITLKNLKSFDEETAEGLRGSGPINSIFFPKLLIGK